GENAYIVISLENKDGSTCENFTASPTEIQGSGRVMILVHNSDLLDYEKLRNTTILVFATGKKSNFSDNATIYIDITDKNDNAPKFNSSGFELSVSENAENGTYVNRITGTDADSSPDFKIKTYSISGGSNRFKVDSNGIITTNCIDCKVELDTEKQADYYMTLFAKDGGGSKSSVVLHVTLTDMNDNSPKFSRPIYTSFIEENVMKDIIKLEASDRDQQNNSNSEFTFSIVNTTEHGDFASLNLTLNVTSGDIGLATPIDYEDLHNTEGNVNITVEVTDKGQKSLSTTAVVQLSVQDKNDNQPYFNSTMYEAKIGENETSTLENKTLVTQVFAHDNDVTKQNKDINYFKTGGSDKFTVDASSGKIYIQIDSKLDRETEPRYNLLIIAMDQGSPPKSGSTTVTINVTDVNDEKPTFGDNPQYKTSVTENITEHGHIVYTCNASDRDSDNKLFYSIIKITAENENGKPVANASVKDYFAIHSDNGSVYVNAVLDRETAQTITLTIQVNDTNAFLNIPQTDTATLTITLKDINDNSPVFEHNKYTVSVREDANDGSPLVTIHATDKDINRTIIYTLANGPSPITSFSIDNKTGLLTKTGELDRETHNSVLLHVIATDNGVPPLNSTVIVHVEILDFNDNPPVIENIANANNMHIKENAPSGEELVDVNAKDADEGPNQNITFFMDHNEHFAIDKFTGIISVTNSTDHEKTPEINLRITAKDNPLNEKVQKSSFITLRVFIDDENDNSPTFVKDEYSASVAEDKAVESVVIQVTAKDADEKDTNNSKINYEVVDTLNGKFSIDQNTGEIKINSSLIDLVGSYQLQIMAFDQGNPQLNGTTFVNINVTDKNRHAPEIENYLTEGNELKVYECAVKGSVIHTFSYTDKDHGMNAEATFNISVLQDNVTGVFSLTPTGELKVAGKLDVNKKAKYQFGIVATDKGNPSLTSDMMKISIVLIDVNDHLPSFKLPNVRWSIQENTTYKDYIGTVTAVDEDKDSEPCYNITSSKWEDSFRVNKSNGHIFSVKQLDRELTSFVSFNVTVKDCSISKNVSEACNKTSTSEIEKMKQQTNDTIEVTIDVRDTDDSPPIFKQKKIATGMRRNTQADAELGLKLRNESYISDADTPQNGYLSWTFSNEGNITVSSELQSKIKPNSGLKPCGDGINHIFCVTINGTIKNNKLFSEDLSGFFILTVKVADKGGYDTADITIYLISDSQIITMTILKDKETVSSFKDDLLSKLSEILGYSAVFDSLQDHYENGVLNIQSSELKFHVVEKESQAVLSGKKAIELFDTHANNGEMLELQNNYNVMRVSQQAATEDDAEAGSKKLTFILVAVSVAEALIITLIIFIALSARNKFRRKLKAAIINTSGNE
ncbi:protein dachsous-like, partial [Mercenaria mercenaria]|uniref:protein dachsous-like n=1 Tax=Mercenaria mercenaria TaxID=6596 RepID=UPI00234FA21E